MNANSSAQLLKAHSIISRSWVLAQIEKGKELNKSAEKYKSRVSTENELIKWYDREDHTLYDVCADDHCRGDTNILLHHFRGGGIHAGGPQTPPNRHKSTTHTKQITHRIS